MASIFIIAPQLLSLRHAESQALDGSISPLLIPTTIMNLPACFSTHFWTWYRVGTCYDKADNSHQEGFKEVATRKSGSPTSTVGALYEIPKGKSSTVTWLSESDARFIEA
ncbi:hypothetical protein EV702DRAFT_1050958 [Suillus placidus]|uniref:Uncharacterized protein n=1 Tax=Suillus placidus TaxID=48579 RepID=A0A9P6ZHR6_9AGAM|nr:hypothetical protein EV702DRAFT_1050958 [Suillus placidus]